MKLLLTILFSIIILSGFAEEKKNKTKAVLDILEKEFKDIKSISAEFDQTKKMSLFKRDIKLSGRLLIKFPQYFRWEVDKPVKTTVTADGDNIEIWEEETGETQRTSIKNNPIVKNIWAQIDSWFMGKYTKLSKDYHIDLLTSEKSASSVPIMVFKPKSKPLSVVIESVTLFFNDGNKDTSKRKYLKKVILKEKGGDSTTMIFKNVKITL